MNGEKVLRKMLKELRTGLYTVIIMSLLHRHGALHGYRLRMLIMVISNGLLSPSESTIYESLKMMERLGLVKSFWAESEYGPPRKYYELTDFGRSILRKVHNEIKGLQKVLERIMGEP